MAAVGGCRRPNAQNKPNLAHPGKKSGGPGAKRHCMPGQPPTRSGAGSTKRRIVRNEANFARLRAADGGNCARRSQTWGDWGIWAKAAVVWAVARPGSETCKTNPISPAEGGRRKANAQNEPNFTRLRARAGGEMRKTRRPRQKSECRSSILDSDAGRPVFRASRDFCRRRQTKPISKCHVSSLEFQGVKSERVRAQPSDFKLRTSNFKLPAHRPGGRGCVQNKANRWRAEMGLTAAKDKGYERRTTREPEGAGVRYLFGRDRRKSCLPRDLAAAAPAGRRRGSCLLGTGLIESSRLTGGLRTRGVPPEVRSG
jgi:hypothetical protein